MPNDHGRKAKELLQAAPAQVTSLPASSLSSERFAQPVDESSQRFEFEVGGACPPPLCKEDPMLLCLHVELAAGATRRANESEALTEAPDSASERSWMSDWVAMEQECQPWPTAHSLHD